MRRNVPLKPSRGTTWPVDESNAIYARDRGRCVGPAAGFAGDCYGQLERDHVRASHGIGMKSESVRQNGVLLCSVHHAWKTVHGREARPMLLDYLARFYGMPA
jgi:5-methylcytosine-specific restriction endonuclease McrA